MDISIFTRSYLNPSFLSLHLLLLRLIHGRELPYERVVFGLSYFGVGLYNRRLADDLHTRVSLPRRVAECSDETEYATCEKGRSDYFSSPDNLGKRDLYCTESALSTGLTHHFIQGKREIDGDHSAVQLL